MRFYTDPFRKDAETVWAVAWSEPQFSGYTATRSGVFADYYRTVTFSDGSEQRVLFESRPTDLFSDGGGGAYTQSGPRKPGEWGHRVYYPGLVADSQRVHADKRS